MRSSLLFSGLLCLTVAAGCPSPSQYPPSPDHQSPEVEEGLQACAELPEAAAAQWVSGASLEPSGPATPEALPEVGASTWALALDLLRATEGDRSVAASPTAMALSMGMAKTEYEGGQCAEQIQTRMHFTMEGDTLHHALGTAIAVLEGRSLPAGDDTDPVVLSIEPSIWSFSGSVARQDLPAYGASVHSLGEDRTAARAVMNCVVEAQTHGLVSAFLPSGQPHEAATSMDLVVPYLRAPWESRLDDAGMRSFERDDGTEVSLAAMSGELVAELDQSDQRWALDLPLRGGLSVLLVMPSPQQPTDMGTFADELSAAQLAGIRRSLDYSDVKLRMPKVDIPSETVDYYEPLGFECEPFTIDHLFHGATVQMDEKGVEAASASYVGHWVTGGELPELVEFTIDRPFLFFVYDRPTNFVLFSGRFAG